MMVAGGLLFLPGAKCGVGKSRRAILIRCKSGSRAGLLPVVGRGWPTTTTKSHGQGQGTHRSSWNSRVRLVQWTTDDAVGGCTKELIPTILR